MNKEFFIGLMSGRRMSMRGLAQRMGMQHSQLSLTLNGQRKMTLDEAAQLSQIFGVPLHQIVTNTGVSVRPFSGRRTKVIGFVGKDGMLAMNPTDVIERAETPEDLPDDAVAAQFRTAESALDFCDGWVAFFRQTDGIDPDAIGRLAFVKIKGDGHAISTIRRGYQPGAYNLSGFVNRQNVHLESASPVLVIRP